VHKPTECSAALIGREFTVTVDQVLGDWLP
jgi:hypothetical protein